MTSLRRGVALAIALLALAGGATACGGDDGPSDEDIEAAREQGEKEERDRQRLRDIERELREQRKRDRDDGGGSSPPSGGGSQPRRTDCGAGVQAGPNTSCAFARNVREEYYTAGGSGSMSITVYSPTTDRTYTMSCTGGTPHACTGGNNASAYFP